MKTEAPCAGLLELFAGIGKIITSSLELDPIMLGIMEEVRLFFKPENWSLICVNDDTGELYFAIAEGLSSDAIGDIRLNPGEGIAGAVVESGQAVFIPIAAEDPRFSDRVDRETGFVTKSIIAVPVKLRDRVYGVIEIINRSSGQAFTSEEHVILQTIADYAAIAFHNHDLHAALEEMAETDALTGVLNRTVLNRYLDDSTVPPGEFAILAMADMNKFKEINDKFGHEVGDRVLVRLCEALSERETRADQIVRLGGDEFVVMTFAPDEASAAAAAFRLDEMMGHAAAAGLAFDPKFSFSYSVQIGRSADLKRLLHDADLAMYSGKRDRVGVM